MADVKKRGMAASEVVRCADAQGVVLYGHIESAEGDHLCAILDVEIVERGFAELAGRAC